MITRFLKFFFGVRDKSGAQCAVGLSANRPLGSTVILNSVAMYEQETINIILYSKRWCKLKAYSFS